MWSSIEELSYVDTIGMVNFSLGKSLQQDDVAFIRVFGRKLDVAVQVVECLVESRWPFSPSRLVPYACFTNDE
ncbi:hypothetical protein D3C84_1283260 [compost metagenome]